MLDKIAKIKSIAFEELVNSDNVMLLLSVYSALWLNGKNPGWCNKCMRDFYNQIITEGETQYKIYMEIKKRTCVPGWEGIRYIRGAFYDSATITDVQALDALKHGYLRDIHFKVLPLGEEIKSTNSIEIAGNIEDLQKVKRGRKPKNK